MRLNSSASPVCRSVAISRCGKADADRQKLKFQRGDVVARVAHMIKLTEECEIAPYVWVHPDEERRGRRNRRKKGRPLRSRCPRTRWREPMSRTSNVNARTRLEGGFSSAIKFCFRKHFGVGLIAQHCCQHLGNPSPSAPSPLLSLRDRSQQSPSFAALRRAATAFECNADVNPLRPL